MGMLAGCMEMFWRFSQRTFRTGLAESSWRWNFYNYFLWRWWHVFVHYFSLKSSCTAL